MGLDLGSKELDQDSLRAFGRLLFEGSDAKDCFLVEITSTRWVSDLYVFSCRAPFLLTFAERVVLKVDLGFLPKVPSTSRISQETILPLSRRTPGSRFTVSLRGVF